MYRFLIACWTYLYRVHSLCRIDHDNSAFLRLSNIQQLVADIDRLSPSAALLLVTQVDGPVQFLWDVLQVSKAAVDLPLGVAPTGVVSTVARLMENKKCLLSGSLLAIHCNRKCLNYRINSVATVSML